MEFSFDIAGGDFGRAGQASSEVKKILKQLNLKPPTIKRMAVAMYEAEVNVVAHAYKGTLQLIVSADKIYMKIEDEGPGIKDIGLAMQEGFSTATEEVRQMGFGAGMGLPNMKRNVDELKVSSTVGKGTCVELITKIN